MRKIFTVFMMLIFSAGIIFAQTQTPTAPKTKTVKKEAASKKTPKAPKEAKAPKAKRTPEPAKAEAAQAPPVQPAPAVAPVPTAAPEPAALPGEVKKVEAAATSETKSGLDQAKQTVEKKAEEVKLNVMDKAKCAEEEAKKKLDALKPK